MFKIVSCGACTTTSTKQDDLNCKRFNIDIILLAFLFTEILVSVLKESI